MTQSKKHKDSLFQRKGSPNWWIRRMVAHPQVGELRLSTRTTDQRLARRLDDMVVEFRDRGLFAPLMALKAGHVSLKDLSEHRDPLRLQRLLEERASPLVGPLLGEWLATAAETTSIRDSSMRRYRASWKHVESIGLLTPSLRLSGIDQALINRFKLERRDEAKRQGRKLARATINRDLAAIGSFLSWCKREKGLTVVRPALTYLQEPEGRLRWLSLDEVAAFRLACEPAWWPLFALLFSTGITVGEALGLSVNDVDLSTMRLSIHEEGGPALKRKSRARDLAIPKSVIPLLDQQIARVGASGTERIFPVTYWPARDAWHRACRAAGIAGATVHDTRHSFAVHAVQQGIPEARLQKLLGHAHPGTTRRYAQHAPEQFATQDMDRVAKGLGIAELSAA